MKIQKKFKKFIQCDYNIYIIVVLHPKFINLIIYI